MERFPVPVTVNNLFNAVGLEPRPALRWHTAIPTADRGVYAVALTSDPNSHIGVLGKAPWT